MTEKEFENLKVGDKVWIFIGKPKKTFVIAKRKDIWSDILSVKVDDGGFHPTYVAEYVFLTKSEALEAEIKHEEKIVENNERGIEKAKERIDRYKAELAKAKEEEESEQKVWIVDFEEGSVICSTKWRWEHSGECYEYETGSDRYKPCSTEQEAHEALSKHLERKLFKALEKCGWKFAIWGWSVAVVRINESNGEFWWCDFYPHHSGGSVRKTDVFDTLEEAEAELERRKK